MPAIAQNALPYLVVAALAIVFWLSSRRWRRLAGRFPHVGHAPPYTVSFQNGAALGVRFRGLLSIGASPAGLYVAPSLPPLRWLYPAMCVPWALVYPIGEYRAIFLTVGFRLGAPDGPKLEIFKVGQPYGVIAPYLPYAGTGGGA